MHKYHMNLKKIRQGQIYINNVCNLACPNCSSYNNFKFKGHLAWRDSKDKIAKWQEYVTFDELAILGGEPFSHPDLDTWVYNLRDMYPDVKDFRITTNATLLQSNADRIRSYLAKGVIIECSIHSQDQFDTTWADVIQILGQRPYHINRQDDAFYFVSASQTLFELRPAWEFINNSIHSIENNTVHFHNSDPEVAHSACKWNDCNYFVDGNLYKCVVTATIGLFAKQFNVAEEHHKLIENIQYADPYLPKEQIYAFLDSIERACAQCSLCPEHVEFSKMTIPIKKVDV